MLPIIFPGFLSSSIIGRAPWPLSLDGPGPWTSRARSILSRISQNLSYCPPGASRPHYSRPSLLFSTRIPTGVRTDFGEERYNDYGRPANNVRLLVETLDGSGRVIDRAFGFVRGIVPVFNRSYWVVPVKTPGASYRVTVTSFEWRDGA